MNSILYRFDPMSSGFHWMESIRLNVSQSKCWFVECLFVYWFVCCFQYSNMRNGATQAQHGSAHKALNIIWPVIHFIVDGRPCYTIPSIWERPPPHHTMAYNWAHSILGAVTLIWNGMAKVGRWGRGQLAQATQARNQNWKVSNLQ